MIKKLIIFTILLIVINLFWTIISLETAPLIKWSEEILTCNTDQWALRGQIGDIMSGHFSALAFLAVALSIFFQYEANKQMRESIDKQETAIQQTKESIEQQTKANLEQAKNTLQQAEAIKLQAQSIEQQNEALRVQSETLKAQIEELTASREESKRQTEEFFIQNMNVKLDRYYQLLDKNILNRSNEAEWYNRVKNTITNNDPYTKNKYEKLEKELKIITQIINLIYFEIENTSKINTTAHFNFKQEFTIRLKSEPFIFQLKKYFEPFKNTDSSKLIE